MVHIVPDSCRLHYFTVRSLAKGYDTFCAVGDFIEKNAVGDPSELSLKLSVNDQVRQHGPTKDMVFKCAFSFSFIWI